MLNILLAGVGGQGTVLASKIIAKAAISRGEAAHTAETIGMAQRGGCVVSHVRLGENAHSPLIPKGGADVIIGFEPSEAVRVLPYLKKNGTVIISTAAVKPVTDSLSESEYEPSVMTDFLEKQDISLIKVDGNAVISKCGSAKPLNVALLGAAAKAGLIGIDFESVKEIVSTELNPKFRDVNLKALELGAAAVLKK